MPNHGGNLLTFFELSMIHPSIEKKKKEKKAAPGRIEKGGVEVVHMFVCLVVLMWA